jgi:hypothetical protein
MPNFLTDLPDYAWLIALSGLVVAVIVFLLGRRLLARIPSHVWVRLLPTPLLRLAKFAQVGPFSPARVARDRLAPRRKGNCVEVQLTDVTTDTPVRGWVLDHTLQGLCLLVEQSRLEGQQLQVRPRKCPRATPWTPVRVRDCRAGTVGFELTCRFVSRPENKVLLLFG